MKLVQVFYQCHVLGVKFGFMLRFCIIVSQKHSASWSFVIQCVRDETDFQHPNSETV